MFNRAFFRVQVHANSHVQLNVSTGAFLRQNVFKRQVAYELCQNIHFHLRRLCGSTVFVFSHFDTPKGSKDLRQP